MKGVTIMTTKEKAKKLVNKMYFVDDPMGKYPMCFDTAKQCALMAVDEIIEHTHYFLDGLGRDGIPSMFGDELEYWESVKYEIKKYEANS